MKKILSMIIAVICLLCINITAFAGNGDGSGGGNGRPLALVASSVENNQQNVPTDSEIVLEFSKNVVNFTVREENAKCFSLVDGKGNNVNIEVVMGDDQVDSSVKNFITVVPEKLENDMVYTLTIDSNITSKSGVNMQEDAVITFSTGEINQNVNEPAKMPTGIICLLIGALVVIVAAVFIKKSKK